MAGCWHRLLHLPLNSPFTFWSTEERSACCAMLRLGLEVSKTVLGHVAMHPPHAHERFLAPFRRLLDLWLRDRSRRDRAHV